MGRAANEYYLITNSSIPGRDPQSSGIDLFLYQSKDSPAYFKIVVVQHPNEYNIRDIFIDICDYSNIRQAYSIQGSGLPSGTLIKNSTPEIPQKVYEQGFFEPSDVTKKLLITIHINYEYGEVSPSDGTFSIVPAIREINWNIDDPVVIQRIWSAYWRF